MVSAFEDCPNDALPAEAPLRRSHRRTGDSDIGEAGNDGEGAIGPEIVDDRDLSAQGGCGHGRVWSVMAADEDTGGCSLRWRRHLPARTNRANPDKKACMPCPRLGKPEEASSRRQTPSGA
jgi:hypothetical protein